MVERLNQDHLDKSKLYEFNGVLWDISNEPYHPLCPEHRVKLVPYRAKNAFEQARYMTTNPPDLICPKDDANYYLPGRSKESATQYVKDVISGEYKNKDIVQVDEDRFVTVQKSAVKDDRFKIEVQLEKDTKTDIARYAVIYLIDRQGKKKSQSFLDLEKEKLSFDTADAHPKDVISRITVEFPGSKSHIEKREE